MSQPLREIAASFGIEWDDDALQEGTQTIDGAIGLLRDFGTLFAGNALVQGLIGFADEFAAQANRVSDTATRLGLAADELQSLEGATAHAGVGADQLSQALSTLARQADGAAHGNEGAAAAFRALGIRATEADGSVRPLGDLTDDLADGFGHISDPARRVALATQLFGDAGARLLPILHSGEGGVAALREEFAALGGGMGGETLEAAQRYREAMQRWNVVGQSVRATLAGSLLPVLTNVVTWVTRAVAWWRRLTDGTNVVRIGLIALAAAAVAAAAPVVAAWLPVIAPFLLLALAVAALVLVWDDLITMFQGGESAIGHLLDSLFGVGTAEAVVKKLTGAWREFKQGILQAWASVREFWREYGPTIKQMGAKAIELATTITTALNGAWGSVRRGFGRLITWIADNLAGVLGPVLRLVGRVVPGAREMADSLERARSNYREVRGTGGSGSVFAQVPAGTVQGYSPAQMASARPAAQVTRTQTNHITVQGAHDPQATAREVTRQLEERERAQNDADHSIFGGDDDEPAAGAGG